MRFTTECKEVILTLLSQNKKDTLLIETLEGENAEEEINLDFEDRKDAKRVIDIDGIAVDISEETEKKLSKIVFGLERNNLVMYKEDECDCGCGDDCHCKDGDKKDGCDCGCGCGDDCHCSDK